MERRVKAILAVTKDKKMPLYELVRLYKLKLEDLVELSNLMVTLEEPLEYPARPYAAKIKKLMSHGWQPPSGGHMFTTFVVLDEAGAGAGAGGAGPAGDVQPVVLTRSGRIVKPIVRYVDM